MVLRKLRRYIRLLLCSCVVIFLVIFLLLNNHLPQQAPTSGHGTSTRIKHLQSRSTSPFCSQFNETMLNLDHENFPNCRPKMEWMRDNWETHACYSELGVDGSECSSFVYLSQIEQHCPPAFPSHSNIPPASVIQSRKLEELLLLLSDSDVNYNFIKSRITRLFPKWIQGINELQNSIPNLWNRPRLNLILYLGFLSHETGLKFGEKSTTGGPLGEMVQWADLITSVFILGHNVSISSEWNSFKTKADEYENQGPCPRLDGKQVDLIFTDIMGLRRIKRKKKNFFTSNKCKFRMLDSFGTHAEFNSNAYFKAHSSQIGGKNAWGGHELALQQFLTMYPHTDDNTFLGFVVETYDFHETVARENITVVYGKEKYMWKDSEPILQIAANYTQIHATVADSDEIMPAFH
uniref:alpha-1,6-mannosyl-glycoprotein 6-beta-N-acetylglucosaminyltransferase n=1 Tax=Acrobeloides nanus TaxID=290746 RepID=A0A914EGP4_9BILA